MGAERRDSGSRWAWAVTVVVVAAVIDAIALFGLPQPLLTRIGAAESTSRPASAATVDPVETAAAEVRRVQTELLTEEPECFGAAAFARGAGVCAGTPGGITPSPETVDRDFGPFPDCYSQPHESTLKVCDIGSAAGAPRVLVLGDSHARVLLGAFQRLADHGAVSVSAAVKASCAWSTLPIVARNDPGRVTRCTAWRQHLTAWLERHAKDYDLVVTTAYVDRMVGSNAAKVDAVVDAWRPVVAAGVPIVAVRDNPRWPADPNSCLIERGVDRAGQCRVSRAVGLGTFDPYQRAAREVPSARYVDLTRYFCDDEGCPAVIGGVDVYRNDNHVSATYASTLAPWILAELAERDLLG